jgi:hypothetical protein
MENDNFRLAVVAHEDMEDDDALNTTDPCEIIHAATSGDAWREFYNRYNTNDFSAYELG